MEFKDKIKTISLAPSATPTRRGVEFDLKKSRDKQWDADIPAYRRLRKDGVQPPRVDGSAEREKHAESRIQVEGG